MLNEWLNKGTGADDIPTRVGRKKGNVRRQWEPGRELRLWEGCTVPDTWQQSSHYPLIVSPLKEEYGSPPP